MLIQKSYFPGRPIDLSSLAFEDTISSKMLYSSLLFSSFISVCTSFARVLKWGRKPVIQSLVSFNFLKIILLIITRFLIQSYFLSMAVKSLMYYYVIRIEYFIQNDSKSYQLFNIYYRGIEGYIHPEILTFKQATLYAPIILITILYLPSFFYVLKISFKFFGSKNWFKNFFENPVLFIFPLLTSFSFYEILTESRLKPQKKTQEIESSEEEELRELEPQEAMNLGSERKTRFGRKVKVPDRYQS